MKIKGFEKVYKIIKTEFAFNRIFKSFEELETELFDYVNWYNNFRIHSSLNYLTPVEYKKSVLIKIVQKRVDNPKRKEDFTTYNKLMNYLNVWKTKILSIEL